MNTGTIMHTETSMVNINQSAPERLSIIIPVYNEAAHIRSVIDTIRMVILPNDIRKEIIIVDDKSTDGTDAILQKYANEPDIKLFRHEQNLGKTAAVLLGVKHASGSIIVLQDGDLEYSPMEYPNLIIPILAGRTKVVYGSRWKGSIRKMKFINRIANQISTTTTNLLLGTRLTDVFCCHKAFRKEVLNSLTITSINFMFDSELTVKLLRYGHQIEEVPIQYVARSRQDGKKMNWIFALEMYWGLIKYRF